MHDVRIHAHPPTRKIDEKFKSEGKFQRGGPVKEFIYNGATCMTHCDNNFAQALYMNGIKVCGLLVVGSSSRTSKQQP